MGRKPIYSMAGIALAVALAGCQQTGNKGPLVKNPTKQPAAIGWNKPAPATPGGGFGNPSAVNQATNNKNMNQGVLGEQNANPLVGLGQKPDSKIPASPIKPGANSYTTNPGLPPAPVVPASGQGQSLGSLTPATFVPPPAPIELPPIQPPHNPLQPAAGTGALPPMPPLDPLQPPTPVGKGHAAGSSPTLPPALPAPLEPAPGGPALLPPNMKAPPPLPY